MLPVDGRPSRVQVVARVDDEQGEHDWDRTGAVQLPLMAATSSSSLYASPHWETVRGPEPELGPAWWEQDLGCRARAAGP